MGSVNASQAAGLTETGCAGSCTGVEKTDLNCSALRKEASIQLATQLSLATSNTGNQALFALPRELATRSPLMAGRQIQPRPRLWPAPTTTTN